MASLMDQQQSEFKQYFCKICNKRFGCGRALGGHMRAHGIGDESRYVDDDDAGSDWEDKLGGNKRMYGLRTNPNRLKSCRVCENCGKEFFSWKSFLEHGKCSYKDVDQSFVSSEDGGDDDDGFTRRGSAGYWSKRKRTLRTEVGVCPSSEEEDLANCLIMLSNATGNVPFIIDQPEESSNTMNFVTPNVVPTDKAKGVVSKGLFECKACKKVFNSHQALGGHRASHKKVKGCFAARFDRDHVDDTLPDDDEHDEFFVTKPTQTFRFEQTLSASTSKKKSKVHECSICHRVFSSGQALGGHKRCHWITSNSTADHHRRHTSSMVKFNQFQAHHQRPKFVDESQPLDLKLDLNLPVSTEIYLQQLQNDNNKNDKIKNNCKQNEEDREERKVKLAKLSELKDVNMSGGSSSWLQVGIGSTAN